jgi:DNA sulfur modification protein DndE
MTSKRQIVNAKLVIFNIIFLMLISFLVSTYNIFYLQTVNGTITEANTTITNTISPQELDTIMSQISNSDKPEDIATLAYIWGYPLITIERSFNYFTNPNTPNVPGQGPANELNCAKELVNANFTDVVLPNEDTLYCQAWMNLTNEPLVLKVPPISDRYYTFEFLDAYTNVYNYVGTRASGSSGGTYLITGPDWNGEVPKEMTKIWSPTNTAWILNRILVKGDSDLPNVHAIQDNISIVPFSVYTGNKTISSSSSSSLHQTNVSKTVPIKPQPATIPTTGIKLFDEISQAMIGNPLNPSDPILVNKLKSIGIGPGKTPSIEANDTIKSALEIGISKGDKLIKSKVNSIGTTINGWSYNTQTGIYGNNYLNRAAITDLGFGANIPQEALYPTTLTDPKGIPYNGTNNYIIHFEPGQTPPVDAFWSISMYNIEKYFVDNPINRYSIGKYTDGLKYNTDGSLDIYIQNQTPGPSKESNWLPSPEEGFLMTLRMYLPTEQILNGTYIPPPVKS